METLIIGKPAINIYLPLQEFLCEGDIFTIKTKNESLGNVSATSSILLAKWGVKNNFTGVVGNDGYAEKVRETFKTYGVNTKYMETNFEKGTSVNYMILNAKTGIVSKILYSDPDAQLTKYKYDFTPQFAIIDGTDHAGAHALLNNNGSVKTVFYGRIGDRDTIAMSKRCTYVVCTQTFAEMLTRISPDNTAESLVNFYQKIVDAAGSSNYIVILNNHKILYSVDGQVKMLPEMKFHVVDNSSFDSVFVGALSFALIKNLTLDDAIKFANTSAGISLSKIGEAAAIPELDEVLDNSGLREKFGMAKASVAPAQAEAPAPLHPNAYEAAPVANNATPDMNSMQVAAPIQGMPQVVETPVEMPQVVDNVVPTQNQVVQTPVEMPQPQVPNNTNIFDTNNV